MKIPGKPSAKQVLGVMADGTELRIANMGIEKGEIAIYGLETISLPARLGKLRTTGAAQDPPGHAADKRMLQGALAMGAHDDQFTVGCFGFLENFFSRKTFTHFDFSYPLDQIRVVAALFFAKLVEPLADRD